ncbi:solute:sodium symporter family transporter [Pedobacter steynii]|uniref:Solute:sodium symporter family transporter n=1 Tax=Pedobacter steynii TaxID=430522 RepID=A0A1D7QCC7_9SPHI|nr:solute:sodium symporter family transporter [Pedobacter steynii]AOM76341.1 solute:sodium symporter family transporter [Pedobacter steynii]
MNITAFATFIIVTFLVALISWVKTRRHKITTSAGLFLANRKLSFTAVGTALFFTNISAAEFVGNSESVYLNNMTVMAWGISSVFAMLIVSEFVIPVYLKGAMSTTPDFLENRYDSQTKKLVSIVFLIGYMVNLLPIVLYTGAVALNGLFHFSDIWDISYGASIWILVWCIGLIGSLYSILGGLKAIVISDLVLGVCMFSGALLLAYFGLKYVGNGDLQNGIHTILSSKTEHLNSIGTAGDAIPFSTIFTGMILMNLFYWGTEQVIVQQALASSNLEASQKGIALACAGKLLGPLLFILPGIIAVHMYQSMENTTEVFSRVVSEVSPPVLSGFIAAVIFGAAITSFSPGLNSASTLFILNLYKPFKEKEGIPVTEKNLLKTSKRFEMFASLLAMFIAPLFLFSSDSFYTFMQKINAAFSIPIFTIMFVGFVTKKVPPIAAKIGLAFCLTGYILTQMVFDTGIHFLHVLAILFVLTSVIMLIIGKLYPMERAYVAQNKPVVDLKPWKYRHWVNGLLLLIMILLFLLFSPLYLSAAR